MVIRRPTPIDSVNGWRAAGKLKCERRHWFPTGQGELAQRGNEWIYGYDAASYMINSKKDIISITFDLHESAWSRYSEIYFIPRWKHLWMTENFSILWSMLGILVGSYNRAAFRQPIQSPVIRRRTRGVADP